MLNPNRLNSMLDAFFIRAAEFEQIIGFVVGAGTIGASMGIGIDVDTDSAKVEGEGGVTAERTLITNTPNVIVSTGTGSPQLVDVIGGLKGFKMNTAGDSAHALAKIPRDMDWRHGYVAYVIWASDSTTAADTVDWKLLRGDLIVPEVTTLSATAAATAFTQETVAGVAKRVQRTAGLAVAGSAASRGVAGSAEFLNIGVEMDAKAGGLAENIYMLGLEIEYTRRAGRGLKRQSTQRFIRSQD